MIEEESDEIELIDPNQESLKEVWDNYLVYLRKIEEAKRAPKIE